MREDRSLILRALAPRFIGIHLLAIVLVGLAVGLGSWQYSAYQADRNAAARSLIDAKPVPIAEVFGPDDPFPGNDNGRPLEVTGEWLPLATLMVANREKSVEDDTLGYWIVTPIAVGGPDGAAFPVVIGWAEEPTLERELPQGAADVVAWLQLPEAGVDPDEDPADNVVPTLRIAEFVQRLDRDAYGGFGIATMPAAGLEPVDVNQETQADWSTGARNLFYAFEWWFFGGFAVFAWWRYLRDELSE